MIGIALFTHRRFGEEMLGAACGIVGQQEKVAVLSISTKDSLSGIREQLRESLKNMDDGSGILVLTDMLGGTASNACLELVNEFKIEIITGVNLPMLISALINREKLDLGALARKALQDGGKAILNAKEIFLSRLPKGG